MSGERNVQMVLDGQERGALLSACGRYRYKLWRRWDPLKPSVVFVMLNPSTADAFDDDPTIRRCVGFARDWDAGGIRVVNLFAWRATNPIDLPTGPEAVCEQPAAGIVNRNDAAIAAAPDHGSRIIAAWGAHQGAAVEHRRRVVLDLLGRRGLTVEALGLTKGGAPRHPLYVRADTEPVVFATPRAVAA